jgi:hypothetical protein
MWGGEQVFSFLLGTIQGKITKNYSLGKGIHMGPLFSLSEKIPTTNVSLFVPLRIWPFSYIFLLVNAVVEVVVVLLKILLVVGSVGLVAGCFEAGRMQLWNNRGGNFGTSPCRVELLDQN